MCKVRLHFRSDDVTTHTLIKETIKGISTQIFVALGIIFVILIAFLAYLFIADPFNIKPMIFGSFAPSAKTGDKATVGANETMNASSTTPAVSGGFSLSEAQIQALVSFGIDPSVIPSTVSPEMEACFVSALGDARVGEVKAGAVPSAFEFFKAKSCI